MEEKNLVTLPNKVADYLEYMKENNYTLKGTLNVVIGQGETKKFMDNYLEYGANQKKFALAWINGYKREEKFVVKVRNCSGANCLNYNIEDKNFAFSTEEETRDCKTKFTREFLEKNGFGWVFDCEGMLVYEVREND